MRTALLCEDGPQADFGLSTNRVATHSLSKAARLTFVLLVKIRRRSFGSIDVLKCSAKIKRTISACEIAVIE